MNDANRTRNCCAAKNPFDSLAALENRSGQAFAAPVKNAGLQDERTQRTTQIGPLPTAVAVGQFSADRLF
jgi:hypothetical protein